MTPAVDPARYKNHRFPGEIISHGVWLYYRFPLSYRDVEEILLERGVDVTHEAIRQWCLKFGQDYANQLKHRRAQPGDKWHLDEVFLTINGQRHYLWRAVDQDLRELGRNYRDKAGGLSAGAVSIEPKVRPLLSGDGINPNNLTMPVTVSRRDDLGATPDLQEGRRNYLRENNMGLFNALNVLSASN
jgi:hypothetical protein